MKGERPLLDVSNFDRMRIGLASPEQIRQWSYGEVKKPETINYRTLKPERDGLFCEKIFGPTRDWECHCGKYKRVRYKGIVCDRCGVEVTRSKVRRERLGHIELAAPVSHIWYFKGIPSRMGLLLDMSPRSLEKVLYFVSYIVLEPGDTPLMKKQLLTETEYREYREKYGQRFQAGMGAEAIKNMLMEMDLEKLAHELRSELKEVSGQRKIRAIRRLEVVEAFIVSHNRPEWMILDVVPVIPPELRPMVQLDGGRFATSDLNDLYRRVINRNNRLKRLLDLGAPDIIVRNEKRMLQEAVDALIDNGRRGRPVTGPGNRPLKSLSDMLKGKQGRFRQNLLGKRVDYSGRSVIVVGPELKFHQCGLPKEMALELFKPFVMKRLVNDGHAHNIKSAKRMVERVRPEVWDVLEEVIREHPVMLNRAPTLHRLGIQAFEPVLVEGKAIKLHPLVCTAYNADFDGDQMAVHVPLSPEAQAETRLLMLASNNILAPKDGKPVVTPAQDMVLGNYYLTMEEAYDKNNPDTHINRNEGRFFSSFEEANIALANGEIGHHTRIVVKPSSTHKQFTEEQNDKYLVTTIGKMIFNQILPPSFPYLNEASDENLLEKTPDKYFISKGENPQDYFQKLSSDDIPQPFKKGFLSKIIGQVFKLYEITETSKMLDDLKDLGFKYSTISGITVSIADMNVYPKKDIILQQANNQVNEIFEQYDLGMLTDNERKTLVIQVWKQALDEIKAGVISSLDHKNNLFMMSDSRARGSIENFVQLIGMRGLMNNPKGETIEVPVQASFREGLTVSEFFISTHGARKGSTDSP